MCSCGRLQWGPEAPGAGRLFCRARSRSELSLPALLRDALLFFVPHCLACFVISLFRTQVVTTITRLRSSLIRSSSSPTGVPVVFQQFINSLSNPWTSLQKEKKDLYQNTGFSQSAGFKPAWRDPIGFLLHHLNHPATPTADINFGNGIYVESAHKYLLQ